MIELVEVEPGRWRVARETSPVARSELPRPYVISDAMPPTEQVDGAANGRGIPVTKVVGKPGLPVVYTTTSGTMGGGLARSAMAGGTMIVSDGTSREAFVGDIMMNL